MLRRAIIIRVSKRPSALKSLWRYCSSWVCYEFERSSTSMQTWKKLRKVRKDSFKKKSTSVRSTCVLYVHRHKRTHGFHRRTKIYIDFYIYYETRHSLLYAIICIVFLRSFQRCNCNKWWLILENDKGWERKTFFKVFFFSYKNAVLGSWLDRMRKSMK